MTKPNAVRQSVQRYRERVRRAGFRLVQLWVADTRAQGFAAECRRQSRAAARSKRAENEVMMWIEANEGAAATQGGCADASGHVEDRAGCGRMMLSLKGRTRLIAAK